MTTRLLACGSVAGPLFLVAVLVQARRLAARGERGWAGSLRRGRRGARPAECLAGPGLGIRLLLATAVQFGFLVAPATHLPGVRAAGHAT